MMICDIPKNKNHKSYLKPASSIHYAFPINLPGLQKRDSTCIQLSRMCHLTDMARGPEMG